MRRTSKSLTKALRRSKYVLAIVVLFGAGAVASGALGMVSLAGGDTTTAATDSTSPGDPATDAATTSDPATTTDAAPATTTPATATPAGQPTIASDKVDYAPGSTVHLTGDNWQPGEAVRIFTNDTIGSTWNQTDDVTADANGNIADDVVLPNYFISDYNVTATGAQSGTATTSFTDAVNYALLGKDGQGHNPANKNESEEDLGSVTSGTNVAATCPTGLGAKASGLGGNQSTSYAISYVSGFGDNSSLSPRTTVTPSAGTFNGNGTTCTSLTISTTGLGAATYHGELQMTNTGGSTGNPDFYYFRFTVVQTQQATAISAVAGSGTYAGTATLAATLKAGSTPLVGKTISFTLGGTSVGSATTDSSGVASLSGVSLNGFNAGTSNGAVGAAFAGDTGFSSSSGSGNLAVAQASSATTITCPASVAYDGSAKTPCSATVTGAGGLNQSAGVSYSNNTAAGTATANASYAGDANHSGSSDSKTFTIAKASSTTTVSCPAGVAYDGSAKTPCSATVSGAGGLNQTLTVTYSNNTGAGTAGASANFAGDANHDPSSDSKTFTIGKAGSTTTLTCPASVTYDGSAQTPCSATVTGVGGLNQSVSVGYTNNTNAGTASASATFAGDANHNGSSDSKTFTIAKANQTISFTDAPFSGTFDQTFQAHPTASSGLPIALSGTAGVCSVTPDALQLGVFDVKMLSGTGTCTLTASQAGNGNYNAAGDVSRNVAAAKAAQTITFAALADKTFGDVDFSVFASASSSLAVSFAASGDCSVGGATVHITGAGNCTVTASQSGNSNYTAAPGVARSFAITKAGSSTTVSCNAGPFTYTGSPHNPCTAGVSGAGGLNQPLSVDYTNNTNAGTASASASYPGDANHTSSSDSKTFTIDKAGSTVTVSCPSDPLTYTGDALTPCTAGVSGVGGLNQSLAVDYTNNTNAGTAAASATYGGDDNHNGSAGSGSFKIDKASSGVALSCADGPFVYSGSPHTPCTAKVTGAGGLNTPLDVSYSDNVAAGTAHAAASYDGDANHTGSSDSKTFTIDKAASAVSVTCPSDAQTYNGAPIEPCSASVTGAGGLNKNLGVVYGNNKNAGTATASAAYAGDDNHKGSDSSATFTIAKAPSTVTVSCDPGPFTYTGDAQTPCSASVKGAGGLDATLPVSYTGNVNAGTATAAASYGGDANHLTDSGSKTFAIGKAASKVAVGCDAGPFRYNGGAFTPCSASVTGAGGLNQALQPTYANNTGAGTATASAGYDGDANHTGDSSSKTFTIDKAPSALTVTCPDTRVYTGNAIEPCTAKATGAGGLDQAVAVSYSSNVGAGTASASASYAGGANHLPSAGSATFTITKAPSTTTVTCTGGPFTYTGAAQTPCTAKAAGAGGLNANLTVSYADNVSAGTATASAAYAGDANHTGSSDSRPFTIGKATPTVNVSWNGWTYDGAAHAATGSVTGVGGAALGTPMFTYYNGGTATGTPLAGAPSGVGTFTVVGAYAGSANYLAATAQPKTITVIYRWDGFLQPINDTAHQGGFESFFKLGSTVPAKFQLKRADGTVMQAGALPVFSRSTAPVSCDTQLTPEALATDPGTAGSTFRWDATAQQYIYNWSTKGLNAGEYRIYATLDDGSKQYVDICLR